MHANGSLSWEAVAARQHGVLSRRQAISLGITRRQIDGFLKRGSWIRMLPGVYRAAAAPETWQQPLMAASLWADGKAVICGRSAAALWEFDGYWRMRLLRFVAATRHCLPSGKATQAGGYHGALWHSPNQCCKDHPRPYAGGLTADAGANLG